MVFVLLLLQAVKCSKDAEAISQATKHENVDRTRPTQPLSLLVRYQYPFPPVNLVTMLPFRAPADVVCAIASGHSDPAPMCSLYYV